ncbi:Protein CHLOROPLAST IMPORT APPARATUS 2 [Bienertia sinuspersici]
MKRERETRQGSLLRSPKREEQQLVPESYQNIGTLEEIKGFLGISNFDAKVEEADNCKLEDHFWGNNTNSEGHEFFGWEFFSSSLDTEEVFQNHREIMDESFHKIVDINSNDNNGDIKREEDLGSFNGFWDENVMEETKASLKLNLNYEEVLEAWSNRGSLWAHNHHHHPSLSISNNHYMGEVPNLEDERTRRETSVLRYKEKRHNRLFSKKIRYEVRKLNADKRPRLKGRFVKRVADTSNPSMISQDDKISST